MKEHEASSGLSIGAYVAHRGTRLHSHELQAVVQAATAIRPFEKFLVPAELDGSAGAFQAAAGAVPAQSQDRPPGDAGLSALQARAGNDPEVA
jgi:hypothetical protein